MVEAEGAAVVMVGNGLEAVECIRRDGAAAFDVVLTDIQMPVMDGYEAAREIHQMAPTLPIIGQTAHALTEERERCLAAGMVDHIAKPINADKLVAMVLQHSGKRPAAASAPVVPPPAEVEIPANSGPTLIDWVGMTATYGKKPAFMDKLLKLALDSHGDFPEKLRAAADAGDLKQIAFHAHTLKGVAGNLMATGLMDQARTVELAAKADEAGVPARALELADGMEQMLDEIRARRAAV
jgi:CheY-like chemotaxis protein